jgi:uncharacterized membrane protein YfcA
MAGVTPLVFVLIVASISFGAGFLGALLGLGGGLIVVPALTLLMKVDIRLAIGASIISVIATSSGAAAAYVRDRMANLRLAMFLEIGTTVGAITGAYLAGLLHPRWLFILFGVVLGYSAIVMLRGRKEAPSGEISMVSTTSPKVAAHPSKCSMPRLFSPSGSRKRCIVYSSTIVLLIGVPVAKVTPWPLCRSSR